MLGGWLLESGCRAAEDRQAEQLLRRGSPRLSRLPPSRGLLGGLESGEVAAALYQTDLLEICHLGC